MLKTIIEALVKLLLKAIGFATSYKTQEAAENIQETVEIVTDAGKAVIQSVTRPLAPRRLKIKNNLRKRRFKSLFKEKENGKN